MIKPKFALALLLIAFVFILPVAGLFGGNAEAIKKFEKRDMATFPKMERFTTNAARAFFRGLDEFIRDHTALRQPILDLVSRAHTALDVVPDSGRIVIGKEGWLFVSSEYNGLLPQLTGKKVMADSELKEKADKYENLAKLAAAHNIPFFMFVTPDKESVYPEYLPRRVKPATSRYIDPLIAELHKRGIPLFDATDTLKAHKSEGILYYRTDTHWNLLGGLRGLEGFLAFLRDRGVDVDATIPGIKLEPGPVFEGDLVGYGLVYGMQYKTGDRYVVSGLPEPVQKIENDTVYNPNAIGKLRVWLFCDSFSQFIYNYYDALFPVVVRIHNSLVVDRMAAMLASDTEPKPDLIVLQVVERFL